MKKLIFKLESLFEATIKEHLDLTKPILIGYSGGIDSQALAALLLSMQKKLELNLHFLHIDHAWRDESYQESLRLMEYLSQFNCSAYCQRLEFSSGFPKSNIEETLRLKRFEVFKKYYDQTQAGALMLAHQKDDLAETVFKRVFEGASLSKLFGFKYVSQFQNMKVLRPLLDIKKESLKAYLEHKGLFYLDDKTNDDQHYLRARQRLHIFPQIEKSFGKNAVSNLVKFSKKMDLVDSYLQERSKRFHQYHLTGPLGSYIDFNQDLDKHPLEVECFLKKIFSDLKIKVAGDQIEAIVSKIFRKEMSKKFLFVNYDVVLERGLCFIIKKLKPQTFPPFIDITNGEASFESEDFLWKVRSCETLLSNSVERFFKGRIQYHLEAGLLTIKKEKELLLKQSLDSKIPGFIKEFTPFFIKDEQDISNPWIKTVKQLKEKYGVELLFEAKIDR